MVLLNASKMARSSAKIVNKPTCGGSPKKCGLSPKVGYVLSSNILKLRMTNTLAMQLVCVPPRTIQTQKYGYSAVHHPM